MNIQDKTYSILYMFVDFNTSGSKDTLSTTHSKGLQRKKWHPLQIYKKTPNPFLGGIQVKAIIHFPYYILVHTNNYNNTGAGADKETQMS